MRAASAWRRGTRSTCALAGVELAVQGEKEKGGKVLKVLKVLSF
jgi:hypothetical protein